MYTRTDICPHNALNSTISLYNERKKQEAFFS